MIETDAELPEGSNKAGWDPGLVGTRFTGIPHCALKRGHGCWLNPSTGNPPRKLALQNWPGLQVASKLSKWACAACLFLRAPLFCGFSKETNRNNIIRMSFLPFFFFPWAIGRGVRSYKDIPISRFMGEGLVETGAPGFPARNANPGPWALALWESSHRSYPKRNMGKARWLQNGT